MRDWEESRRLYVEEGKSLREIAQRQGICYGTLKNRSYREKWAAQRNARGKPQVGIDRVARKLLERIEGKLQEDQGLEIKDFKTVSGALKELSELCGEKEKSGGETGTLTVRFVGETEEMSR